MKEVIVGILRRDLSDLTDAEKEVVSKAFPDSQLVWTRMDSKDYLEHATACAEVQPTIVILPKDRPIPAKAMEEGFPHVVISPNGLLELEPLQPTFKPFQPK